MSDRSTMFSRRLFKSPYIPLESQANYDQVASDGWHANTSFPSDSHYGNSMVHSHFAISSSGASFPRDISSLVTAPRPALFGRFASHDISARETVPQPTLSGALPNGNTSPPFPPARHIKDLSKKTKILLILLVILLLPIAPIIADGINVYTILSHTKGGIQHLLTVKDMFSGAKAHPTQLLDAHTLQTARGELVAAQSDFQQLRDAVDRDALINSLPFILPMTNAQVTSLRAISQMGVDTTDIGQKLLLTAEFLAPSFHGSVLTDSKKPLITSPMLDQVRTTIEYILPLVNDLQVQSSMLSLDSLPLNAQQHAQVLQLIQGIPLAQSDLVQAHDLLGALGWILGVDGPRTLLVQTMDRSELRATGGFTGQFGELQINGARVAPFSLKNIGPYEENNPNSPVNGQLAPAQFRSWWPIPNWGLRDANLSADFPTSAQIVINSYNFEFKHSVDGVIVFSPILIEHVLQITGPIKIPAYHETITAQNLEERLHYYQLDNAGIRKEEIIEHVEDPAAARKLFTSGLSRIMIDELRHAPPTVLLSIAREMLHDLKTKDLQVYVTNPQIESLLEKHGDAAVIDTSTTHDGLYVVQTNLSASKASQYVRTLMHDVVTLDTNGGATHVLQMRLVYNQIGSVFGLDTYRDYVRIYVPPTSKFLWGDGFDTGTPFCGAGFGACPQYDAYSNGDLLCPAGQSEPGAATSMLNDPFIGLNHPLDKVGAPTNFKSDVAGRSMFGGWIVVPKNCSMTVSLSWYVPPTGHNPYTLLVQRQSSTFPELDLTILPAPGDCTTLKTHGKHFDGILSEQDMTFSLKNSSRTKNESTSCYPQPGT